MGEFNPNIQMDETPTLNIQMDETPTLNIQMDEPQH
jgi:hypothetical protein